MKDIRITEISNGVNAFRSFYKRRIGLKLVYTWFLRNRNFIATGFSEDFCLFKEVFELTLISITYWTSELRVYFSLHNKRPTERVEDYWSQMFLLKLCMG